MAKNNPVPTRFDAPEEDAIETLHARTGLSRAEIIRRAVRLLAQRYRSEKSAGFIIDELGPDNGGWKATTGHEDDVSPRGYGQKNVVEMPAPKTHKVSYAVKLSQKKKRQAARKKAHAA
jgi:hypothetical protein